MFELRCGTKVYTLGADVVVVGVAEFLWHGRWIPFWQSRVITAITIALFKLFVSIISKHLDSAG